MSELRDKRGLTEAEAIERYRLKNYPKPALTADIAVFAKSEMGLKLLLIRLNTWRRSFVFSDSASF